MKLPANGPRLFSRYLFASLLIASSVTAAQAGTSRLADDTLIVVTKPNADTTRLKADIYSNAHAVSIVELHANKDNWSILLVTPGPGQRESTLSKIASMSAQHPEIRGLSRNGLNKRWFGFGGNPNPTPTRPGPPRRPTQPSPPTPPTLPSPGSAASPPNDPDYSHQWPLPNMNWPAAQASDQTLQKGAAHVTILATGVNPNTTDSELGTYITQYNASNPPQVTAESLHDVDDNTLGPNTPGEGSIDSQMSGSLTDNKTALSGAASFGPYPVDEIMLRIAAANDPEEASEAAIDNALMWALNNQTARGGAGPINMSYGTDIQELGSTPLWTNSDIEAFASSFANQGDILVVSAGDAPGTWTGANAYIPTGCVVAQGSDQNNNLVNTLPSNIYGSGAGLTTVAGDPIAAPGTLQPCVGPNGSLIPASIYGTSFSAPFVSSAIALLRTVNSSLTCEQAFAIIVSSGTTAGAASPPVSPSYKVVIPNFAAAIQAAAP